MCSSKKLLWQRVLVMPRWKGLRSQRSHLKMPQCTALLQIFLEKFRPARMRIELERCEENGGRTYVNPHWGLFVSCCCSLGLEGWEGDSAQLCLKHHAGWLWQRSVCILTSREEMEEKPAAKPVQRCLAENCDSTQDKRREMERCAMDAGKSLSLHQVELHHFHSLVAPRGLDCFHVFPCSSIRCWPELLSLQATEALWGSLEFSKQAQRAEFVCSAWGWWRHRRTRIFGVSAIDQQLRFWVSMEYPKIFHIQGVPDDPRCTMPKALLIRQETYQKRFKSHDWTWGRFWQKQFQLLDIRGPPCASYFEFDKQIAILKVQNQAELFSYLCLIIAPHR